MKTLRFALRSLLREARAGELAVLVMALTIAVGSVTAIGFLTDRIGQAVALQASEVLAADLRLEAPTEPDPTLLRQARERGLRTATLKSFPSVVYIGEDSALAAVRAATDGYPLRGKVRIADQLLGTPRDAEGIPTPGSVWLETGLLAQLGAEVGDRVELGASTLTVSAVITYRPDQSPGFSGLAPALIMHADDLEAAQLLGEGSRLRYAYLFAGERDAVRDFASALEDELPPDARLRDRGDAGRETERCHFPCVTFSGAGVAGEFVAGRRGGGDVGKTVRATAFGHRRVDEKHWRDARVYCPHHVNSAGCTGPDRQRAWRCAGLCDGARAVEHTGRLVAR